MPKPETHIVTHKTENEQSVRSMCGRQSGINAVALSFSADWSNVNCAACIRVMGARHDKPCR
jgi:hypothetical protein